MLVLQDKPPVSCLHLTSSMLMRTACGTLSMHLFLQMESISMHNALMLLGEESVSSTAKRGKREGKRLKDAAAKTDSKGRKAAAPKKAAEHKQEATKVHCPCASDMHLAAFLQAWASHKDLTVQHMC